MHWSKPTSGIAVVLLAALAVGAVAAIVSRPLADPRTVAVVAVVAAFVGALAALGAKFGGWLSTPYW